MKAAVYAKYGPPEVVQIREVPKPVPADNELLVKVLASTVSSADWRMRSLEMPPGFALFGRPAFGFRGPRKSILGTELAGVVESVGRGVKAYREGDQVFAFPGAQLGCHAEYRCVAANGPVALAPAGLTIEQASALSFGGATMLDFYRRAELKSGERVLVNGGAGTVGTAAIQLARHFGAQVTGVCSTGNLDLVSAIGADKVIDYTRQDFSQSGERYDVIVDAVGNAPFARSGRCLAPGGRLLAIVASLAGLLKAPVVSLLTNRKVIAGPAAERVAYIHQLCELAEAGRFTPVIDRVFAFEQVRAAHEYVGAGHKKGSVVLSMEGVADDGRSSQGW
ncbi:MAG: NAD(P)-dependent alcohol dehydrogenase [Burkholderiaceae bacterium]